MSFFGMAGKIGRGLDTVGAAVGGAGVAGAIGMQRGLGAIGSAGSFSPTGLIGAMNNLGGMPSGRGLLNSGVRKLAGGSYLSRAGYGAAGGAAYGAMSDDTSVLGGALGGAAMGAGARYGAKAARRAYGHAFRGFGISKGFGFGSGGTGPVGVKMSASQPIRSASTGPSGARMAANQPISPVSYRKRVKVGGHYIGGVPRGVNPRPAPMPMSRTRGTR